MLAEFIISIINIIFFVKYLGKPFTNEISLSDGEFQSIKLFSYRSDFECFSPYRHCCSHHD